MGGNAENEGRIKTGTVAPMVRAKSSQRWRVWAEKSYKSRGNRHTEPTSRFAMADKWGIVPVQPNGGEK